MQFLRIVDENKDEHYINTEYISRIVWKEEAEDLHVTVMEPEVTFCTLNSRIKIQPTTIVIHGLQARELIKALNKDSVVKTDTRGGKNQNEWNNN